MGDESRSGGWLWLFAVIPFALCCGLPVLASAGFAAVGSWFAAHGLVVLGSALLVVAAGVAAGWGLRRRGDDSPGPQLRGRR